MSLKNKVALITGGGSGIGAAIAIKFTQEGAKVVIVGRTRNKLKDVAETCQQIGAKPFIIVADVTKDYELVSIVTETVGIYGKIDIVVNNAGIGGNTSILDSNTMDAFDKIMATNLYAAVRLTNLAAKHLVETKGNIINISSIASITAVKNGFAYCASKAALDHFTRSIALELASKGVRVNSINPGPVKTDILGSTGLPSEEIDKIWELFKKATLLDRVSEAEEVAELVALVVSDKGRSITGATLVMDNGTVLKGLAN